MMSWSVCRGSEVEEGGRLPACRKCGSTLEKDNEASAGVDDEDGNFEVLRCGCAHHLEVFSACNAMEAYEIRAPAPYWNSRVLAAPPFASNCSNVEKQGNVLLEGGSRLFEGMETGSCSAIILAGRSAPAPPISAASHGCFGSISQTTTIHHNRTTTNKTASPSFPPTRQSFRRPLWPPS